MSNFDSIQAENIAFLDVGNTAFKLGRRLEDHWEIQAFKKSEDLAEILNEQSVDYILASSVRSGSEWLEPLVEHVQVLVFEPADIPAHLLHYETPETLGMDRFLACLGAYVHTGKTTVVIDAGSACTIDCMNSSGVFEGGVIMPGLSSLLGVFATSAPALPETLFSIPEIFPGKSSKASVQWGIAQLFVDGLNANLTRYEEQFGEFELYLTGGDAGLIQDKLHRSVTIRPDLIFEGMIALAEF